MERYDEHVTASLALLTLFPAGSKSIYILLLIYAASTTTTVIPCVAILLNTPVSENPVPGIISVTASQRQLLLSSYVPFLLLPLLMTVDMAFRILALVRTGLAAQNKVKRS